LVLKVATKEIKINELHDFYDALARDLMKKHEKRFADKTKAVTEASTGLGIAGARLEAGVQSAWGSMEKQASEYGMRLARTLQESAQNLSRKETTAGFRDAEHFHEDAVRALNEIIRTVRRYAPKLHRMLRPEMSALNSSLVRLEKSITDLGAALDDSPGLKLESLQRDVQAVKDKRDELFRLRSEEDAERSLLEAASNRENEVKSKEQELMSHPEFLELGKYEKSLELKEDEIKQLIQPLVKPLLKLERAAAAKQGPTIDVKALRDLVDSPVETVMAGQRFASMQLLSTLEQALDGGRLEIVDRKRRKAEEAIQALKQGALDKARDECLALQANTQETLRQLKAKSLLDKRDELNCQLAETRSEIESIEGRLRELQRRIDDMGAAISKLRASIESHIGNISHESVTIISE
jgi:DNA repair exonuclease SbcCD ATPase subunit